MLIDEKSSRWLSRRNARVSGNQGKIAPWIAPSGACAWFENKRFDWPSVSFSFATLLSINLISSFCTQFQLSALISSFCTQTISSFCTVWDKLTYSQPISMDKFFHVYYLLLNKTVGYSSLLSRGQQRQWLQLRKKTLSFGFHRYIRHVLTTLAASWLYTIANRRIWRKLNFIRISLRPLVHGHWHGRRFQVKLNFYAGKSLFCLTFTSAILSCFSGVSAPFSSSFESSTTIWLTLSRVGLKRVSGSKMQRTPATKANTDMMPYGRIGCTRSYGSNIMPFYSSFCQ